MIQRIETMVKGMGEMSLEAIYTWFPKRDKDELRSEIMSSPNLNIEGNVVKYIKEPKAKKTPVKILEKDIDISTKTSTIVKEESVEAVEIINSNVEDVSLKALIESVNKYNEEVNVKLDALNTASYENKLKAIRKYYDERFIIEDNETIKGKGYEFITLKHKQKGVEIAYLLVADVVKRNIIDEIYKNYRYDTVYFCQLDEQSEKIELPLGEYYYKECSELITSYMTKYKLVKRTIDVYEIVEE